MELHSGRYWRVTVISTTAPARYSVEPVTKYDAQYGWCRFSSLTTATKVCDLLNKLWEEGIRD